jgi:hypothetical protein
LDAATAIARELRALPVYAVPERVVAAAALAIERENRVVPLHARAGGVARALRWLPATVAAAAVLLLVATARWSAPVVTVSSGLAEAQVERATRETMLAFSYLNQYARMTGEIVAVDVLEKRVMGTMERAVDREVLERGLATPLRAIRKPKNVETEAPRERS